MIELRPAPAVLDALRALADWPGVALFDSALVREPVGRYSFLTADPVRTLELADAESGCDPYAVCRRWIAEFATPRQAELPPFQGGCAGICAYELGRAFERIPRAAYDEFESPALAVGLYDWVIAWDHRQSRAWLISQGIAGPDDANRSARARERANAVMERLSSASGHRDLDHAAHSDELPQASLARQYPAAGLAGLTSNFSMSAYLAAVSRVKEYIAAGDIFQANLCQRLLYPQSESPLELYCRLRARNPAPFAGYFAWNDWAVASASPERFLCLDGDRLETRPIKGTRRRKTVPEADLFTRDELRESEKDLAENVMIVDLLRNDLSRVCRPGTLRVPQLHAVETYATVQHLVSVVEGRVKPNVSAWDALAAAFPGGSITGAPKVRAMEIVAELEPTARGPYTGSMFYVGLNGDMDSNLLIRTFTIRRGWVQCAVGGGIVYDSDPLAEYEETLHKAAGMLNALIESPARNP